MSKLTYIRCGDYDIPNLKLSEQPETSIGKYGRMRKSYLKKHRPILYNQLLMSEKLYPHLLEILCPWNVAICRLVEVYNSHFVPCIVREREL